MDDSDIEAERPEPDRRALMTVRIETDRLILRTHTPEDAEALHHAINHWEVARMLSRVPWPYTRADAEQFIATVSERDRRYDQPLAIVHRQYGLIGGSGFYRSDDLPFPEFGYWITPDHWGQGYASEAAHAALTWAHRGWGRRAIRAGHIADNHASGRVLVKVGMLYTGVVEPQMCLARGEAVPTRKMVWLA